MKISLLTVFLLGFFFSQAQLVETTEIEIPLSDDMEDDFSVISLDSSGVILINFQETIFGKKGKLIFHRLNAELKKEWQNSIDIDPTYQVVKYYHGYSNLYCLLKEKDSQKIKIIKLNIEFGDAIITECKMLTDMDIEFFCAIENKVVITGKYNDKPVAELIRLFDRTSKVLPQIYSNNLKILSLEANEKSKEIYLMLKDDNKCRFMISVFDYDGKLLYMKDIGDKNHVVLNSKVLKVSDSNIYLAGNFADNCSEFSVGFYVTPLGNLDDIQFFKFNELQNFYSNLSPKRQLKLKSRMLTKKEKGKDPKIRQRLNLQQPIISNNEVLLAAEVYFPEYKNAATFSRNTLIHLGENYRTARDYNNYKITQGLLFTFDFLGRKTWDYSIDLKNIETEVLNSKMQVNYVQDGILVAFPKDDMIEIKLISKINPPLEFEPFKLIDKNKEFVSEVSVDLFAWYKKTFLAFGYKSAKNNSGLSSKEYFYLKKLAYQTPEIK